MEARSQTMIIGFTIICSGLFLATDPMGLLRIMDRSPIGFSPSFWTLVGFGSILVLMSLFLLISDRISDRMWEKEFKGMQDSDKIAKEKFI